MHNPIDQVQSAELELVEPHSPSETLEPSVVMAEIVSCEVLDLTCLVESIERCDIKGTEVDALLHSFSALSYDEGAPIINGLRKLREGASPLRYGHISALCNFLVAHETNTRMPTEATASHLQRMEANWHFRFAGWAKADRPM